MNKLVAVESSTYKQNKNCMSSPNEISKQSRSYRSYTPAHIDNNYTSFNNFFLSALPFSGLPDFPLSLPLGHNLGHPSLPGAEFWSPNFALHPSLLPPNHGSLLHPNVMHNYKMPNIHAILSQYMGLNNLFGYPQNLSMRTPPSTAANIPPPPPTSGGSLATTPVTSSPSVSPKDSSMVNVSAGSGGSLSSKDDK